MNGSDSTNTHTKPPSPHTSNDNDNNLKQKRTRQILSTEARRRCRKVDTVTVKVPNRENKYCVSAIDWHFDLLPSSVCAYIHTHTYIYICSFACVYDPQTSSPIHEPKPQHYHTNTPPPQKNKGSAVPRGVYTFDAHPLTMAGGVALAALPSRSELLLVGLVG